MPKNAYLFAKVGADTAENEKNIAEFWQNSHLIYSLRFCPPGEQRDGHDVVLQRDAGGPALAVRTGVSWEHELNHHRNRSKYSLLL